jgi:chorismate mutase
MKDKLQLVELGSWGLENIEKPLIISGPCSAETEEQVLETARQLKKIGVNIYRAGIWKPRTKPGSFEGVGSEALQWLKKVKEETGMLVCTEVANVKHVHEALQAGVDILWIGARTTANPFAIQEIADALQTVNIPVLIKNPVNPDIDLWEGAIERIYKAGIRRIGAIHRGFSSYEHSIYRNIPQWQLAIDIQRRVPNLLMINDPSHIGGKRELIQPISQKAMDLNFDGLMIESHINPDKAWSDAKQQITPETLNLILNSIVIRDPLPEGAFLDTLENLRHKIDKIDDELMALLQERMKVSVEIGKYKKENNITILQQGRWNSLLKNHKIKGRKWNLTEEFVSKIYKAIHQESINKQTDVMND